MAEVASAARRPTRLSATVQWVLLGLLALSFVSGLALWQAAPDATRSDPQSFFSETPATGKSGWLTAARLVHGAMNPLLCAMFGWLWQTHLSGGWRMRANVWSGVPLAALFAGLILTGLFLYYPELIGASHDPAARQTLIRWHVWLGLALPAVLVGHLLGAWCWAKNLQKSD